MLGRSCFTSYWNTLRKHLFKKVWGAPGWLGPLSGWLLVFGSGHGLRILGSSPVQVPGSVLSGESASPSPFAPPPACAFSLSLKINLKKKNSVELMYTYENRYFLASASENVQKHRHSSHCPSWPCGSLYLAHWWKTRVLWMNSCFQVCSKSLRMSQGHLMRKMKKLRSDQSYNTAAGSNIKGYWPEKV